MPFFYLIVRVWQQMTEPRLFARPRDLSASLICLIVGSAIVVTVGALSLNDRFLLIVERYFTFLTVEVIFIVTLALVPVLIDQPWLSALVTANAAIYLLRASIAVSHDRRWLMDADMVAHSVVQCPEARSHVGSRPPKVGQDPAETVGPVQGEQIGLINVALVDHLTLLSLAPDRPGICPVIYWIEYRAPTELQIVRHNGDIVSAANNSTGFGWMRLWSPTRGVSAAERYGHYFGREQSSQEMRGPMHQRAGFGV